MQKVGLLLVVAFQASCDPFKAPSWPQVGCSDGLQTRNCVALDVLPPTANILRGDTVRIVTRSDSGLARSTWTTSNATAAFATAGGAITSQLATPDTTALVIGMAAGTSEVRAQSPRPQYAATSSIRVADSSSMISLAILRPSARRDTIIKGGVEMALIAELRDAQLVPYIVRPTWTSSDAAIIAVAPPKCGGCYPRAVTKGFGSATVIARFRDLRDTLLIIVEP